MSDRDAFADRGRALEEEYFRKKDRELVEKMRQAAASDEARRELTRSTGLSDPALLAELEELGFTPGTLSLLPLMPVLQVAWAEGGITRAERDAIVTLARTRGIGEGSEADRQLTGWLVTRPDSTFNRANRLIAAMLASSGGQTPLVSAEDLVRQCEGIAGASGGLFGIGRVSAEERALLAQIAAMVAGPRD